MLPGSAQISWNKCGNIIYRTNMCFWEKDTHPVSVKLENLNTAKLALGRNSLIFLELFLSYSWRKLIWTKWFTLLYAQMHIQAENCDSNKIALLGELVKIRCFICWCWKLEQVFLTTLETLTFHLGLNPGQFINPWVWSYPWTPSNVGIWITSPMQAVILIMVCLLY